MEKIQNEAKQNTKTKQNKKKQKQKQIKTKQIPPNTIISEEGASKSPHFPHHVNSELGIGTKK